jgi:RNA polymerase sigma-70 factor, ECF subfamily
MLAGHCSSIDKDALGIPSTLQEAISSELSLVERARSGDDQAFEALIQRYRRRAYTAVYKITRHREDTEDVLQDAILKVYTHLAGFQGKSQFGTWFVAIASNEALMCLRRRRRQERCLPRFGEEAEEWLLPNLPDNRPDAEKAIQQLEIAYAIRWATKRLTPSLRAAFRKRFFDGMSMEETAEELNVSAAAVKSRISRAKIHLRRELKRYLCLAGDDA